MIKMNKNKDGYKMVVNITNIRINSISTLGSLNIGKTIFSRNQASSTTYEEPEYIDKQNNDDESQ